MEIKKNTRVISLIRGLDWTPAIDLEPETELD
jgi:hypothetical protein